MENTEFIIRLAGVNIAIKPLYGYIREYCKEYLTNGKPELTVEISHADIDYERSKSQEQDRLVGMEIRHFPNAYLETLAVYRKIAEALLDYGVLLVHGSCIAVDGEAYLFTAKSGTGKSTHTRLWREYFGDRAVMVNDDKPLLHITEQGVIAYGTPWDGKHRLSANVAVPLKAICTLERGNNNAVTPVGIAESFPWLLEQIYRPLEASKMIKTLSVLEELIQKVKLYRLRCNMETEAAIVSYNGMNCEEKL